MADSAERLVNLALLLSSTRQHVTAEQCRAAGLGYPEDQDTAAFLRMFERDKDALRAAGLVIDVALDPDTDTEAYRLDPDATFARPVEFAADELSAVRAVAAALADDATFPFGEDLALALGKLGAAGQEGPMATTQLSAGIDGQRALDVRSLAESVRTRKAVSFDYTNSQGSARRRRVHPYGLFFREGQWYLTGLDVDIDDIRTFAIERLKDLEVNRVKPRTPDFERPEAFDVREQERLPFQFGGATVPARIRFDADVAWRAERLSRGHGRIETLPDGSAVWQVEVADIERLASWLLDEGPGLHAIEPRELVTALTAGLERVVAAHE